MTNNKKWVGSNNTYSIAKADTEENSNAALSRRFSDLSLNKTASFRAYLARESRANCRTINALNKARRKQRAGDGAALFEVMKSSHAAAPLIADYRARSAAIRRINQAGRDWCDMNLCVSIKRMSNRPEIKITSRRVRDTVLVKCHLRRRSVRLFWKKYVDALPRSAVVCILICIKYFLYRY